VRVVLVVRAVDLLPDFVETKASCVHDAFFFTARCVGYMHMSREDFIIGDESAVPEGLHASANQEAQEPTREGSLDALNSRTDEAVADRFGDGFLSRLREAGL